MNEIEELFDGWNQALVSGEVDRVVALYADDAILLPTLSNRVRHDHGEIAAYFADFLKKQPRGTLTESNVRRFGDVAINSGSYVFRLGDGQEVPCRFTFVYRRSAGAWRIVEHHSSQMPE